MVTKSDNNATSTLWRQLGRTRIKGFLAAARMTGTPAQLRTVEPVRPGAMSVTYQHG